MAADLSIYFDLGGSDGNPGTNQDTDGFGPPNLRFKQEDDAIINTADAMPIPAAGTNYSYWKQIYVNCDTAPATSVDNLKFYTDGVGFGAGIAVKVGDEFPTKNSGSDAGYEVADGAVEMVANHGGLTGSTDVFSFTAGGMLVGPTISEAGNIIDAQNETSNYMVFQMEVTNAASAGDLADETFTLQYDEI